MPCLNPAVNMSKCECQWLSWIPKCYGHCKSQQQVQLPDRWRTEVSHIAEKERTARWGTEIKPEMEELPIAKVAEEIAEPGEDLSVMEEKAQKIKTKQKMEAKLALLKKEVELGGQLLRQTKTLLKSKEALLKKKVRGKKKDEK